jgi:hypothetical protein
MSICERVNAVECHSIALYEVILQEMWQNLLYLVGRSRLWFSASNPPISAVGRNQFDELLKYVLRDSVYSSLIHIPTYWYLSNPF